MAESGSGRGWAVVTGASAGIGLEFARALARRGHPVLAVARRQARLVELREELAREGGRVEVLALDLCAPEAPARVAAQARALGPIALLVNNAAFASYGPFAAQPLHRELEILQLGVATVVELTHRLLPALIEGPAAAVINVASTQAFQPVPGMATYSASKAFVLSFSESLAQELEPRGVRVLCLCPGPTATEFNEVAGTHAIVSRAPVLMSPERVVAIALQALERGRVVQVAGLLNAVGAFLPRIAPRSLVRAVAGWLFRPPPSLPP